MKDRPTRPGPDFSTPEGILGWHLRIQAIVLSTRPNGHVIEHVLNSAADALDVVRRTTATDTRQQTLGGQSSNNIVPFKTSRDAP